MKKILFFAAAAVAMLASCSQNDDLTAPTVAQNAQQQTAVLFGTYLGRQAETRTYTSGPISNTTNATSGETALYEAGFGVFSYLTADLYSNTPTPTTLKPNFMYDQQVTSTDGSTWTYTPIKYWPNGVDTKEGVATDPSNTATEAGAQYLSFFAYAPYMPMSSFSVAGTGTVTTDFPTALGASTAFKTVATPTNGIVGMTTNEFTGNVWVKYLMPNAKASEAIDLLWGLNGKEQYQETDNTPSTSQTIGTGYNMNLTKQTTNEKVKFLFKHALAKLGGNTETTESASEPASAGTGFMIKLDVDAYNGGTLDDKTLVTVEKVEIMDAKSASDAGITTGGETTSNLANSGWFNIEQGVWSNVGIATAGATYSVVAENATANDNDLTDANYSLNPNIKENPSGVSNVVGTAWQATTSGNNDYTGGATGVTVTAVPLFAKETIPGLLVIPSGATQTIYVRIKYYVRTLDANLSDHYSEVVQTITNKVDLSSLASNKYYKIIMHLGLTSVKFEAIVSDWQLKSGSNIDGDGHETGGSGDNESSVWLPSNVVVTTP